VKGKVNMNASLRIDITEAETVTKLSKCLMLHAAAFYDFNIPTGRALKKPPSFIYPFLQLSVEKREGVAWNGVRREEPTL
jgi:hypothetical protein